LYCLQFQEAPQFIYMSIGELEDGLFPPGHLQIYRAIIQNCPYAGSEYYDQQ
jgi:hypothetical protein